MPAPWVAWKRLLSCKQETELVGAVHDPCRSSAASTCSTPSTPTTPASTTKLFNPSHGGSSSASILHHHSKSNNTFGYNKNKKKSRNGAASSSSTNSGHRGPASAIICCSDTLKNVIHGNTTARVAHTESPLPQYVQSHQQYLHQHYSVATASSGGAGHSHGLSHELSTTTTTTTTATNAQNQMITIQHIKESVVAAAAAKEAASPPPNSHQLIMSPLSSTSSSFKLVETRSRLKSLSSATAAALYNAVCSPSPDHAIIPERAQISPCSIQSSCTKPLHVNIPQFRHQTSGSSLTSRHSLSCYPSPSLCHKCGESFENAAALEEHQVTYHSVTELKDTDSARSIVEIIFQTRWLRQDLPSAKSERIFKVHNSSKTVAMFEEYRDMVKAKASKISKKHSRCLVDGNELLRFYSTTITCDMGRSSTTTILSVPSLCTSQACGVCHILRNGFPTENQPGIYTNASSGRAHDSTWFGRTLAASPLARVKSAMLVCRVIAGRVKKMGIESSQDGLPSAYDSAAGEPSPYTDLEELLVFNTTAVLPCFIVIYSC